MKKIRIATRNSPLALWQAGHVRERLLAAHEAIEVELIGMTTEGDRFLAAPLIVAGGKGLFIKELEQALLDRRADIAVHSMKDVTLELPDKLALPVIMARGETRDALVSRDHATLAGLPERAVIGTSSLRRQSQLRALRPDLILKDLRGNVGARLNRLDQREYDAIVLAAAGLQRLGLTDHARQLIPAHQLLPAVGQGAIGIECRAEDSWVKTLIAPLNDPATALCVQAERAFSRALNGGCRLPIAGRAVLERDHEIEEDQLRLTGLVARTDGSEVLEAERRGQPREAEAIGAALARTLLAQGADRILGALLNPPG